MQNSQPSLPSPDASPQCSHLFSATSGLDQHWTQYATPKRTNGVKNSRESLTELEGEEELPESALAGDQAEGKGSQFSAVINLLATAMGAGLLSLPQAFAHCGILTGVIMMLCIGWGADITLQYLVVLSRASGIQGFEQNAQRYLGKWGRRIINVALLLLLFLASVAMLTIIMGLLPEFIQEESGQKNAWYGNPLFIGLCAIVFIFPFTLLEKITLLQYTSFMAICNLIYYFTCLNVRFWYRFDDSPLIHPTVVYHNNDFISILQGFSIMIAAYLCHFNIFKIDTELARPVKGKIWSVIHITIPGIATTIYIVGGLLGYLLFGTQVKNNMLEQFPNDMAMSIARVALSLTNLFKLPLVVQPLRNSIREALPQSWPRYPVLETFLLFCAVFGVAVSLQSLSKALGLLGCTAGVAIALVMPAIMRLQHKDLRRNGPRMPGSSPFHTLMVRIGAYVLAIFGTFFGLGAFFSIIYRWHDQ